MCCGKFIDCNKVQETNKYYGANVLLLRTLDKMHRRRGSAPAVILHQQLSKYNNWDKNGFISEDGKKEKLKGKKLSSKSDFSRSTSPMFPPMEKLSEEDKSKEQTLSDSSINNLICANGFMNNHYSLSRRPSSPTTNERRNDKCSGKRLTIRGQHYCSTEIASITRNNMKKAGSIKDYHIVLLGQGGVGKSGRSSLFACITVTASTKLYLKNELFYWGVLRYG